MMMIALQVNFVTAAFVKKFVTLLHQIRALILNILTVVPILFTRINTPAVAQVHHAAMDMNVHTHYLKSFITRRTLIYVNQ